MGPKHPQAPPFDNELEIADFLAQPQLARFGRGCRNAPKILSDFFITPTSLLLPYFAHGIVSIDTMFLDFYMKCTSLRRVTFRHIQ